MELKSVAFLGGYLTHTHTQEAESRVKIISPQPDLIPDVFCLMVRIFRLMLVLFYIHTHTYTHTRIHTHTRAYIYINSTNIPPIMIINRIQENQNLLSLLLVSFLVRLKTYQHLCYKLLSIQQSVRNAKGLSFLNIIIPCFNA